MDQLPDELLIEIFRYFNQNEILGVLMKVNSRWKELSSSPCLWRDLEISDSNITSLSDRNRSRVIRFVRKLRVSFANINLEECFRTFEEGIVKEVRELKVQDMNKYSSLGLKRVLKEAKTMHYLSSLHLSFHMCCLKELSDVLPFLTALRIISIHHVPPHDGVCVDCSDEHWSKVFESMNLETLTKISLRTNNLENDSFQIILHRGQNLAAMDLDSHILTDICFKDAPENRSLRSIKLRRMQFDDSCAERLAMYAPCIQHFTIHGDLSKLTYKGIEVICEQFKDVVTISLRNSIAETVNISDVILYNIGSKWSCLRSLCLWFFEEITDSGIEAIVSGCPYIEIIDLLNAFNLTDASILALANRCRLLKSIYFRSIEDSRCLFYRHISKIGFQELLIQRKNIQEILLEGFDNLRNISFRLPTDSCLADNKLEAVRADECTLKSKKKKLLKRGRFSKVHKSPKKSKHFDIRKTDHSHLRTITFERCHLLDDESVYEILKFCPDIRHFYIDLCSNISTNVEICALKLWPGLILYRH